MSEQDTVEIEVEIAFDIPMKLAKELHEIAAGLWPRWDSFDKTTDAIYSIIREDWCGGNINGFHRLYGGIPEEDDSEKDSNPGDKSVWNWFREEIKSEVDRAQREYRNARRRERHAGKPAKAPRR